MAKFKFDMGQEVVAAGGARGRVIARTENMAQHVEYVAPVFEAEQLEVALAEPLGGRFVIRHRDGTVTGHHVAKVKDREGKGAKHVPHPEPDEAALERKPVEFVAAENSYTIAVPFEAGGMTQYREEEYAECALSAVV